MSTPNPATTNWVPLWDLNGGVNINYRGDYVAATSYIDGEVVIYNGVAYMCCRPTQNPPAGWPTPAGGVPQPTVNGQFIKGVGGAPTWSSISETDVRSLVIADTVWHLIGAAGEPGFLNGWVNYGGGYPPARFRKDANGFVHLSGLLSGPMGQDAFTLPAGYRPGASFPALHVPIVTNAAFGYAHIFNSGNFRPNGVAGWASIDCVTFLAEA